MNKNAVFFKVEFVNWETGKPNAVMTEKRSLIDFKADNKENKTLTIEDRCTRLI